MENLTIKSKNVYMKDFKKKFGENVRYYRKLAHLTQEQLAEKAGVAPNTIGYIERGKNSIHFSKIPLLADALGIEIYKLFVFVDFDNNPDVITELAKTATQREQELIATIMKAILSL